jgi:hypothetical protein
MKRSYWAGFLLAVSIVLVPSVAVAGPVPMAPSPLPAVPPPPTVTRLPSPTGGELVVRPPSNAIAPYTAPSGQLEPYVYQGRVYDPILNGPTTPYAGTRSPGQSANYAIVPNAPAATVDSSKAANWPAGSLGSRMGGLIPGFAAVMNNPKSDTSMSFLFGLANGCMFGTGNKVCSAVQQQAFDAATPSGVPLPDDYLGILNGGNQPVISGSGLAGPLTGAYIQWTPVAFDGVSTLVWNRTLQKRNPDPNNFCSFAGFCDQTPNQGTGVNMASQVICKDASGNMRTRNGSGYDAVGTLGVNSNIGSDQPNQPFSPGLANGGQFCLGTDTLVSVSWWDTSGANSHVLELDADKWVNPLVSLTPATTIKSDVICKTDAGSLVTVTKTQTGTGNIPVAVCPSGSVPDSLKVSTGVGTDVTRYNTIYNVPAVPQATRDAYPECAGTIAQRTQRCESWIILDEVPCKVGGTDCKKWTEIYALQPSRVKCAYGPYYVDPSLCTALANLYVSEYGVTIDTKAPTGSALQPVDRNNTIIQQPTTINSPITNYSYITNTQTSVEMFEDPKTENNTLVKGAECFPYGWRKLNPVEWIVQPVGCALRTAFLPRQDTVLATTNGLKVKMERLGFKPVSDAIGASLAVMGPAASGCSGPPVHLDFHVFVKDFYPFNACEQPVSTIAGYSYALSTVTIVGAGGFALLRALGAGFGYRVSAGKGES